jgi:ABC-type Fe3+-hydroxamate transport system substrate-binding protein
MKFLLVLLVSALVLSGCSLHSKEVVEQEDKITVVTIDEKMPTSIETVANNNKRALNVKYEVKGKDVYIECYVPNFHFSKENMGKKNKDGEGHIHLYLNGKKITKIYKAAFIVKGLPSGKQTLKIEIAHNNHTPYDGLDEEFEVEIP